jgi:hypothetical protein
MMMFLRSKIRSQYHTILTPLLACMPIFSTPDFVILVCTREKWWEKILRLDMLSSSHIIHVFSCWLCHIMFYHLVF